MWTDAEVEQFKRALKEKNLPVLTKLMNIFQERSAIEDAGDSILGTLPKHPHFSLAFYIASLEKNQEVAKFYLENDVSLKRIYPYVKRPQTTNGLSPTDLSILYYLYSCLESALDDKQLELVDLLLTKYNLDPYFIVPVEYSHYFHKATFFAGLPLIARSSIEEWKILLNPKYRFDINHSWEDKEHQIKEETILLRELMLSRKSNSFEKVQFLLENGADPYHPVIVRGEKTTILDYLSSPGITMYTRQVAFVKEWLSKHGKLRKNEEYSSEHSSGSGSNSPASAGSPQSSPPRHSAILQKTPPDSPVASRSATPPGSPMHSSDNKSSGSAGSSPEKLAVQPTTPYQFSIPPGDSSLVHEFHEALKKNRFQDAKAIYDTGRVKSDCYCAPCKINALHLMMNSHEFKGMEEIEEYVLHHLKYPANINSTNDNRKTILHIMAGRKFMTGKGISVFFQKYADKNPNLSMKDNEGNTPLHYAAVSGGVKSHEVVEELLKHGSDPTIDNLQSLTARELCARSCPNEDVKKKVLAVFDEQLNPYQKQNPSVQAPIVATVRETTNSAAPIIYTGGNKATMFPSQNSSTNGNSLNVVPLSPPAAAQRADAKSVGTLYAPPPQASVELPKHIAKEEPAAPRADTKKSLGDRVKGLFHIK